MAILMRSARPSMFAVFRRRDFTLLWIAQFVSTMGSGLTVIAASILVYRLTGSAWSVGLMLGGSPSACLGWGCSWSARRWPGRYWLRSRSTH
jgi:hypothetical protein